MFRQSEPRHLRVRSFADIVADALPQHVLLAQRLAQVSMGVHRYEPDHRPGEGLRREQMNREINFDAYS